MCNNLSMPCPTWDFPLHQGSPPVVVFAGEGDQGREAAESAENAIYSLLFEECDKEGTGMVDVKELVEYIRRMQLQVKVPGEEEESTDTRDSVS